MSERVRELLDLADRTEREARKWTGNTMLGLIGIASKLREYAQPIADEGEGKCPECGRRKPISDSQVCSQSCFEQSVRRQSAHRRNRNDVR